MSRHEAKTHHADGAGFGAAGAGRLRGGAKGAGGSASVLCRISGDPPGRRRHRQRDGRLGCAAPGRSGRPGRVRVGAADGCVPGEGLSKPHSRRDHTALRDHLRRHRMCGLFRQLRPAQRYGSDHCRLLCDSFADTVRGHLRRAHYCQRAGPCLSGQQSVSGRRRTADLHG